MKFMLTENGNYIVEDKSDIILEHKTSIITRYGFFNKDHKFIKLSEHIVWRQLSLDKTIYDTNDEENIDRYFFEFPTLFQYNFVDETVNNDGDKIRLFYHWIVKFNHIYPVVTFFKNNELLVDIKYDLFVGRILEKSNIEMYKKIITESRNATFPKWTQYLMFNTIKRYNYYMKKQHQQQKIKEVK